MNKKWSKLLLWLTPMLFLGLFFFYPLGNILLISFRRAPQGVSGVSLFWEALRAPQVQRIFAFTIGQAFLSTLFTLLVGLPGAYLLARYEFRGKSLLQSMLGIPFVLPTVVVAAAFNALLGPRGWANLALMNWLNLETPPLQFLNTLTAILLAHVFYNTTIVLRMVGDFWAHINPRLGQAAQMLGAPRLQVWRRVTFPLLLPAISAAALLVFIFDFTSFGVILLLGGPKFATLEVEIYYQTVSLFNLPQAAILALLQLACTLALTVLYTRLSARVTRPLGLKPRKYTQQRLLTWRQRLTAGVLIVVLLGLLTTPLLALAVRSITRFETPVNARNPEIQSRGITLAYYRELGINRRDSLFYTPPLTGIAISLGYAMTTVMFSLLLGLPAAWALAYHRQNWFSRLLDPLLMLPLGTSAVTLGLGYIVTLNRPPIDLRTSPILVPLAHTLVAFPFVVRSLAPALHSIQPRLRQAASILGATPRQILRFIDLPLVGRALIVAATFAFTISLGEFGATALLARPEYPTIPVMIYRFISQPGALNYGQALALSTLLMLVTAGGILAIERLRIADIGEF